MNRRQFFVGAAAAGLAPFALTSSGRAEEFAQDGAKWFTNVPVTAHTGQKLRFYDDVMKSRSFSSTSSLPAAPKPVR